MNNVNKKYIATLELANLLGARFMIMFKKMQNFLLRLANKYLFNT